ncbi:hypothetical protein GDO86_012191 [Hymenochirus boettgeri]|uniref:G-protein coupled receptors family 1 profile domain-containing protein n=1 Tax=Hymenochirus boettgeri TaxID=247094 RepID=A0A8T2IS16_9PIPI|nr:hypothetical protein GDO86_012191 [Hymenochirus boettgeri]
MASIDAGPALLLVVYIITFVAGLPLNVLAFVMLIRKFRQKLLSIDILLFNLTVSDLLLLVFLPFRMVEAASGMKWPMPYIFCPLSTFMYFSSIYITSLILMVISVERYLTVAFPIKYELLKKPRYSIVGSVCVLIIVAINCSPVFLINFLPHEEENKINNSVCYSHFSPAQIRVLLPIRLELFLLLFCIPFLVTSFCCINFVRIMVTQFQIRRRRKLRAIGMMVTTFINFIVCFLPYNVSHVVGFIQGETPRWRNYALLLSTFNALVDPVIFYFCSVTFQKMILEALEDVSLVIRLAFSIQNDLYKNLWQLCTLENPN